MQRARAVFSARQYQRAAVGNGKELHGAGDGEIAEGAQRFAVQLAEIGVCAVLDQDQFFVPTE